jgi:hypothetical protein
LFKNLECDKNFSIKYTKLIKLNNVYTEEKINNIVTLQNNLDLGINISELCYINYKNKYVMELNEYFLKKILILFRDDKNMKDTLNYIYRNKYSPNKILLFFEVSTVHSFPSNIRKLKIIKKYSNLSDMIETHTDKLELKLILEKL